MQNVLLTIPGESERTILVIAGRDSGSGIGAGSSASATAVLLTLADALGSQRHNESIVLASTDGSAEGAAGARELIDALPHPEDVDAAIVISQPGVENPRTPFVVASDNRPDSPNAQLVQTARAITSNTFGERDPAPGAWTDLARLAFPGGRGEQAAMREAGIESLAISAYGERPIDPDRDRVVSAETIEKAGSAALDLILTLDAPTGSLDAGPNDYVRLGDNLIPDWTIALLAIALIAAPLLTAADTWLREQRATWRVRRTVPWALERALMPLAALLLAYALAFIGLIPDPAFPFDPGAFPPGVRAPIALIALAAAFTLAGLMIRPMRTPLDSEAHTLAAAGGIVTGLALVGIWILNPYMGLLLMPAGSVWLLPARAAGPPRWWIVALVALASLAGAIAAFVTAAIDLGLGVAAPWHLLLMIVGGQIGFLMAVLWCVLIGGLIACVSATAAQRVELSSRAPRLRGAGSHIGPGALGSTPAAESRLR
jgi:hypothetical protein